MALIPGVSRSGITITTARFLGIGRVPAAVFSFQLMGPIILGAALWRGLELIQSEPTGTELGILAVAATVSAITGRARGPPAATFRGTHRIGAVRPLPGDRGLGALGLILART